MAARKPIDRNEDPSRFAVWARTRHHRDVDLGAARRAVRAPGDPRRLRR